MLDPNPYSAPEHGIEARAPERDARQTQVRLILWTHLAVIAYCAVLSLSASRQVIVSDEWEWLLHNPLAYLAVFSWFAFPILMGVVVASWNGRSAFVRFGVFALDVALSIFQLWVLLPLVQ